MLPDRLRVPRLQRSDLDEQLVADGARPRRSRDEVGQRAANRSSFDTRNYGFKRLSDLIELRDTGVIAGAISGRALYDGRLDPVEALALLRSTRG